MAVDGKFLIKLYDGKWALYVSPFVGILHAVFTQNPALRSFSVSAEARHR